LSILNVAQRAGLVGTLAADAAVVEGTRASLLKARSSYSGFENARQCR
jgi:hypothetical protein